MSIKSVVWFIVLVAVFAILMYVAGPILICIGSLIGYFWEDIFKQIKKVGKYVARKD
jgi:hypothetical protein